MLNIKIPHLCPRCDGRGIETVTKTAEPDEQHICMWCGGEKIVYSDGEGNWV